MTPKVLIIDDDPSFLRLMEKELEGYAGSFSVLTATDGNEALQMIPGHDVSLVICDLRLPGIDGFDLIGRIIEQYPDIPVIAMTAYGKPRTKEVVMKTGAVDYLTKPVDGAGLSGRILKTLRKKSDGGSLHKVSLETYLQLVEMEEQTCTLRIIHPSQTRTGVLFFYNGQLMDARIGNRNGRGAAYEILSWSGVSLSIENDCIVREKRIDGELQAILLNAMRNRDENADTVNVGAEKPGAARDAYPGPGRQADGKQDPSLPDETIPPVQMAENKLVRSMGKENGIRDAYSDPTWTGLVYQLQNLGQLFEFGSLRVVCINRENEQILVVPEKENVVVVLDKKVPREKAIAVFV